MNPHLSRALLYLFDDQARPMGGSMCDAHGPMRLGAMRVPMCILYSICYQPIRRQGNSAYQLAVVARILVLDRESVFADCVTVSACKGQARARAWTSLRRGDVALRCGIPLHGNGKSAKVSGLLNKQINLIVVQYFSVQINTCLPG